MKAIRHACLAVALGASAVCSTTVALAQDDGTAALRGRVVDTTGGFRFEGARVRIVGTDLSTATDRSGNFRFRDLPAGEYELVVEYLGAPAQRQDVELTAGETRRVDIVIAGSDVEEVRVVGQAAGQAAALTRERNALNNLNVLSADAIGQFPDNNVAEALQRVPGISLERDQGEGRFAVIRGANAEFNTTTVNGLRIPGPEDDSRAVNLDVVSSDLVESVEISKSLLPDQDADAVGGNIEIKTLTAFDLGNSLTASVEGSYNEPLEETSPRISLTGTRLFSVGEGTDNFGVSASFNYFDRSFAVDNVEAGTWPEVTAPDGAEVRSPEAAEQRDYELSRERTGGVLNFDYRPTEDSEYFLRTLYSRFADNEIELEHEYLFEDGDPTEISGDRGLFDNAAVERRGKETTATRDILAFVAGGENLLGDWEADYQAGYAEASTSEPFSLGTALISEGLDIGYDLSDRQVPNLFGQDVAALEDVSGYELDLIELESDETEETETSFELNFARDLRYGNRPGRLQFGGKIRLRDKFNDGNNSNFEDFGGDFTLADFVGSSPRDYPLGRFGPAVDTDRLRQFYFDNRENFTRNEADFLLDSKGEDYDLEENIYAAYAMSEIVFGRLELVGGLRVEQTEIDQNGFRAIVDEGTNDGIPTIEPFSGSNDYTDFFPNLQALYSITESWQLRAALTRTIARPNFEDAGARQLIEIEGGERVAEVGNPELDPLYSNNVDLELSYFSPQGLTAASVGVFYKDIEDFFVSTDVAGQAPFEDFDEVATVTNGESARLYGVELSYVQEFGFLPSPWDGLLLLANYTWVDSEAEVPFRDSKIPLPRQAEDIANLAVGYDKYGLSLRLAANRRGTYFDGVEEEDDPSQDRYVDEEFRLDFTSEYSFTSNWTAILNVQNITDEVFYAYLGNSAFANQYDEFGRTVEFGVRYQF
ncbi:TonB-dependent receptor [Algiphilus aromaticivorans]|uniref:TonB-dependent receptor n=1 Tax=Algiphilus aromaticivorans TaxID=382454 RepID=UPI0005C217B1|nr:TonB-dependent receptor [Algiphilus aromaticivorans]